jgi:hypothetical protein
LSIDLTALVATAFKTVGTAVQGVVRPVTYRQAGGQSYDPATGSMATSYTDHAIEATITSFKRLSKETDFTGNNRQTIEYGDQKCLVPYVIIDGGTEWRVIDFAADPTGKALLTFHLRRS